MRKPKEHLTQSDLELFVHNLLENLVAVGALEGGAAKEHLVDENAKCPPVDGRRVAESSDDLRRNVLGRPPTRIGDEIRHAATRIVRSETRNKRALAC